MDAMDCTPPPPEVGTATLAGEQQQLGLTAGAGATDQAPGTRTLLHAQRVSMAEYRRQAAEGTQQAVRELRASLEYRQHTQRCHRLVQLYQYI